MRLKKILAERECTITKLRSTSQETPVKTGKQKCPTSTNTSPNSNLQYPHPMQNPSLNSTLFPFSTTFSTVMPFMPPPVSSINNGFNTPPDFGTPINNTKLQHHTGFPNQLQHQTPSPFIGHENYQQQQFQHPMQHPSTPPCPSMSPPFMPYSFPMQASPSQNSSSYQMVSFAQQHSQQQFLGTSITNPATVPLSSVFVGNSCSNNTFAAAIQSPILNQNSNSLYLNDWNHATHATQIRS